MGLDLRGEEVQHLGALFGSDRQEEGEGGKRAEQISSSREILNGRAGRRSQLLCPQCHHQLCQAWGDLGYIAAQCTLQSKGGANSFPAMSLSTVNVRPELNMGRVPSQPRWHCRLPIRKLYQTTICSFLELQSL